MDINNGVAAKLLWHAACGDDVGARHLARYVFRRGTPMEEIREGLSRLIAPDFLLPMVEALPWLGDDTFEPEPVASGSPPRERILTELDAVADEGMRLSTLRAKFNNRDRFDSDLAALEDEGAVRSAERQTAGRPARVYWLARFAPATASTPAEPLPDRLFTFIHATGNVGATKPSIAAAFQGEKDLVGAIDGLIESERVDALDRPGRGDRRVMTYWSRESGAVVVEAGVRCYNPDPFAFTGEDARRAAAWYN